MKISLPQSMITWLLPLWNSWTGLKDSCFICKHFQSKTLGAVLIFFSFFHLFLFCFYFVWSTWKHLTCITWRVAASTDNDNLFIISCRYHVTLFYVLIRNVCLLDSYANKNLLPDQRFFEIYLNHCFLSRISDICTIFTTN